MERRPCRKLLKPATNPQLRTGATGPLGGIAAGTFSRLAHRSRGITDKQEPKPDKTSCPSAARSADRSCRLQEALTHSGRKRPPEVQAITRSTSRLCGKKD